MKSKTTFGSRLSVGKAKDRMFSPKYKNLESQNPKD